MLLTAENTIFRIPNWLPVLKLHGAAIHIVVIVVRE